jgi:5-methylcytosine-specific restriction endonuclease McrA
MLGAVTFTKEHLKKMRSCRGGFCKAQIDLCRKIIKELTGSDKGKPSKLVGLKIDQSLINLLINTRNQSLQGYAPKKTRKKQRRHKQFKRPQITQEEIERWKLKGQAIPSQLFYKSREWRELRVSVLEEYECKCMMCGCSPKEHGIVVHVDHIKPRSTHPHLELRKDNLQILCEDCNLGKSNYYITDWRPFKCS